MRSQHKNELGIGIMAIGAFWVLRMSIRQMDFAFIEKADGSAVVLRVNKRREEVTIDEIADRQRVALYREIRSNILDVVCSDPTTLDVDVSHDFVRIMVT